MANRDLEIVAISLYKSIYPNVSDGRVEELVKKEHKIKMDAFFQFGGADTLIIKAKQNGCISTILKRTKPKQTVIALSEMILSKKFVWYTSTDLNRIKEPYRGTTIYEKRQRNILITCYSSNEVIFNIPPNKKYTNEMRK